MTIDDILVILNMWKVRATYGAVADVSGKLASSVGSLLGQRRPEASWVVNSKTDRPSGYSPDQCHKDLCSNPIILRTGVDRQAIITISQKYQ